MYETREILASLLRKGVTMTALLIVCTSAPFTAVDFDRAIKGSNVLKEDPTSGREIEMSAEELRFKLTLRGEGVLSPVEFTCSKQMVNPLSCVLLKALFRS